MTELTSRYFDIKKSHDQVKKKQNFFGNTEVTFKKIHEVPCPDPLAVAPAKLLASIYSLNPDTVSRPH